MIGVLGRGDAAPVVPSGRSGNQSSGALWDII
jgi:hypothetical protein